MHDKPESPRLHRSGNPPQTGIVHFGPGAFFRAFVAIYTEDAARSCAEGCSEGWAEDLAQDWGISAVSLKSATACEQLGPQGGVYHAVELAPQQREIRRVDIVNSITVASEEPEHVLDLLCAPSVHVVSLTITEKGYCHLPATGELNLQHPDIIADLSESGAPRSVHGFIVEALARRRAAGTPAFTVLSCDNLPDNGELTRSVILDFAGQKDKALADWINEQVCFPSTMVDRITPATTDEDIRHTAQATGFTDQGCVIHEPFRQWVIEDNFNSQRPAWENAGAALVSDVKTYELVKLRCLNGTHSVLAYLGYLAGYETVADTVADPLFKRLCECLWSEEILPTVPEPDGMELEQYCKSLMDRYQNTAIRHLTWQIAMDGSQKLPQRWLGTILDNLDRQRPVSGLCLAVAGWMRYVSGVDEHQQSIDVRDPLLDKLQAAREHLDNHDAYVSSLLSISDIFEPTLTNNSRFKETVLTHYSDLQRYGVKQTLARFFSD